MKSNTIASIALLLWAVTIAVFAWFFVRGTTTAGTDKRIAIVLQSSERDQVLSEMRGLLSAVQGILEGANQGDINLIIRSSRSAGMAAAAGENPLLMAKLPLAFKTLAKRAFRAQHPCPATGNHKGACPEYLIHHVMALKRGSADNPSKM